MIAPFSKAQIEDYVSHYTPLEPQPWVTEDYMRILATVPHLMDLVKNPFLFTLALEVLPIISDRKQYFSTVKVTRVELNDTFVVHWLGVNKCRLESNALSYDDHIIFDPLFDAGIISMGFDYSKRLAMAISERQDGNTVVQYTHLHYRGTWKAELFGLDPVVQPLQESSLSIDPLRLSVSISSKIHARVFLLSHHLKPCQE